MRKSLGGGITFQTGITCLADRGPRYGPHHSESPPSKRRRVSVPSILFLAGAGWVVETDAHARGVAVAQRLPSALLLGAGDYSFVNASEGFKGWEADEVALPRS